MLASQETDFTTGSVGGRGDVGCPSAAPTWI